MLRADRLWFLSWAILFLALSSVWLGSVWAPTDRYVAVSSISEAEQSLGQAFVAVSGAEKGGANVSRLLIKLNDGADLLSQSQLALGAGNFDEAASLANSSIALSGQVRDEAARLSVEAGYAAVDRDWLYLMVSVVAISIVLVVSAIGYRRFKQYYYGRLLKMKPKVAKA